MSKAYQQDPNTINFSKISTYLRCPMQYYFSYIQQIKVPPAAALSFGSAFHKALEYNYRQKIESRADLKTKDVQDMFAAEFEAAVEGAKFKEKQDPAEMLDHGVLCVGCYHDPKIAAQYDCQAISPQVQPLMVEQEFIVEFDNLKKKMMGTIDLVAEGDIIRDTKTSASKPSKDSAFKSFQLTTYFLGHRIMTKRDAKGIIIDYVVKTKKPQIISLPDERSEQDVKALLDMIGKIEFAISNNLWYPNPHNFMCTPEGCGYWEICQAGRKVSF